MDRKMLMRGQEKIFQSPSLNLVCFIHPICFIETHSYFVSDIHHMQVPIFMKQLCNGFLSCVFIKEGRKPLNINLLSIF